MTIIIKYSNDNNKIIKAIVIIMIWLIKNKMIVMITMMIETIMAKRKMYKQWDYKM